MITADQIPNEVVEAASEVMAAEEGNLAPAWTYEKTARAAIATAINAWPGMEQLAETSIWIAGGDVHLPARINLPLSPEGGAE